MEEKQWRNSQGRMGERLPQGRQQGENRLTGYRPTEQERREKNAPREVAKLSGSYGDVAVGVNRQKNLSITLSERRGGEEKHTTKSDKKAVEGQTAHKLPATRGKGFTNPHHKSQSAVLYQSQDKKPPPFLQKRFTQMMGNHHQEVLEGHVSFLDTKRERAEEKALITQEKQARKDRGNLSAIQSRRDELSQIITEKKHQSRRFQQLLKQGQQAAQESQVKEWTFLEVRHQLEEEETPESPPEDPTEE
ncbi:MAG: hypothetical protein R3Y62_02260 [Eubacteriales bacterium]